MARLTIGTRSFMVSDDRVVRIADRMFRRMGPEQRRHCVETAKTRLARIIGGADLDAPASSGGIKAAAAILIGQGVTEI